VRMGLCSADEPYSLESRLAEVGMKRGEKGVKAVLQNVDVVAATCIGCGMGPLDRVTFPFIVIDEAAQVIEPAVILPLGKGAVQAVMVGDQCQLPATVLSQEAQSAGLDISMFDRLLSMGMEYTLLTDQYRMHPSISAFPSWRFYRNELKNAVTDRDRPIPNGMPFYSNLVFLHVDAIEASGGSSKRNPAEAQCAAWVVEQGMRYAGMSASDFGIISPYGAQVSEIRRLLPQSVQAACQVSTVDSFQGSEREVIIFSLVRANHRGDVGFVADWRRLNVALTRAKKLCVIIGNIPTWLSAKSGLITDWMGFHQVGRADIRAFRSGALSHLPSDIQAKLSNLRAEFEKNKPEPQRLARAEKASRNVSAAGKKVREMTQSLEDAMKGHDEALLKTVIQQAKEAGVEKSIIDEGESLLEEMVAAKTLNNAISSRDAMALVQAIIQAKMHGVDPGRIQIAEELMHELVVPTDGQGNSFYVKPKEAMAAAPTAEKTHEEPKKKHKQKSWTALVNTGPSYSGKKKTEAEDQASTTDAETEVVDDWATAPEADPVAEDHTTAAPTEREGPPPPGGKKKEGAFLRVRRGLGAGVDLEPTCWGMRVDFVENKPGQPDLVPGCTITAINGISLLGLSNEDEVYDAFERGFRDQGNIPIEVDQVAFETVELPPEAANWPPIFTEDLDSLANKFGIEQNITRMGIELRGPNIAMPEAKSELQLLLNFYKEGQKKEQQRQAEIDAEAMRRMVEEQKKREAEEWAAWEQAVYAWQAEQMAMMAAYVQAVHQQQMEAYAAAHNFQQMQAQQYYQQQAQQQQQQQQQQFYQQQQQLQQQQQEPLSNSALPFHASIAATAIAAERRRGSVPAAARTVRCEDHFEAPLVGRRDAYGGVIVDETTTQFPSLPAHFATSLDLSLLAWKAGNVRGVWLDVPIEKSQLISVATDRGFIFHHADKDHCMLTRWLPSHEASTIPPNASTQVGVGALVVNDDNQVLFVQEAYGPSAGKNIWKIPTGLLEAGEDIAKGVVRELFEETGLEAKFEKVLAFRHSHRAPFGKSDIFFVCLLRTSRRGTSDLKLQQQELVNVKWGSYDEFLKQAPYPSQIPIWDAFYRSCVGPDGVVGNVPGFTTHVKQGGLDARSSKEYLFLPAPAPAPAL